MADLVFHQIASTRYISLDHANIRLKDATFGKIWGQPPLIVVQGWAVLSKRWGLSPNQDGGIHS